MAEQSIEETRGRRRRERSGPRKAGKILERIGGVLLCALVIATPWMFGTTEDWSVRLMNFGSYGAGLIFLAAAICNRVAGHHREEECGERWMRILFLALNVAVLLFCAIAWWNWRATFSVEERSFTYRADAEYVNWLPTTYDAPLTRDTFLTLLACCVFFWCLRYWVFGGERRAGDAEDSAVFRNKRFQAIAWVLALNGMAIALQGILQRLSASPKLLWFRDSYSGFATACFGPFSYRGNAAEYLNLLWPVALGLWWAMARERRRITGATRLFTDGPELMLIPATLVTIAASMITLSRGGAIVAMAILLLIAGMFVVQKRLSKGVRSGIALFVCVVLGGTWLLYSKELKHRFTAAGVGNLSGRAEIYKNVDMMLKDFPAFGSGPGTFRSTYHLYRTEPTDVWHGFLHDDWTETRITFGWVGFGLIVANLALLAVWIFRGGRAPVPREFTWCAAAGLLGALVHAKVDFPFQTYSILFTFVVIASLLTTVSPERR